MSSSNPIGGYFELELPGGSDFMPDGAILLNSGRGCFEYILRAVQAKRVYLPKFTCDAMLQPLEKLHIPYEFYVINEALELESDVTLNEGEYLVYTNYFGVKNQYARRLSEKYKEQLIVDASQAFYFEPTEAGHTFYSPRKFFGMSDGGILYTHAHISDELPFDTSYQRFMHLLKRIDLGAEAGYADFQHNDDSLGKESLKQMSRLTRRILASIDFEAAKEARLDNFTFLHEQLKNYNGLSINLGDVTGPMCYPYVTDDPELRQKLITNKIFVAKYWPNVLEWAQPDELESRLTQCLLPLPIDQRYGREDMERILGVIHG